MARLTVEDCLGHVENRFSLILKASKRARRLAMGGDPFVAWNDDKPTVVALREIAEGHLPAIEAAAEQGNVVEAAFKEEVEEMAAELEGQMQAEAESASMLSAGLKSELNDLSGVADAQQAAEHNDVKIEMPEAAAPSVEAEEKPASEEKPVSEEGQDKPAE